MTIEEHLIDIKRQYPLTHYQANVLVLYFSEGKKATADQVRACLARVHIYSDSSNRLKELVKKGLTRKLDSSIAEYELTIDGEQWIEDSVLSKLSGPLRKDDNAKVIQIVLDFSALKDVLSKGGVVMTAFNCPKCNASVDLPEAGKAVVCKYCGTSIKPVDIFEKIKSLL